MSTIEKSSNSPDPHWYANWFGPKYDALYGHRDQQQAQDQVRMILPWIENIQGPLLDLGCGAGRHLAALKSFGKMPIGLDLSPWLLQSSAQKHNLLVRASMKNLPFREKSFDAVFSFFSSFGYFPTLEDDLEILRNMTKILSSNGILFFDLPNKAQVIQGLHFSEHMIEGEKVTQDRTLSGDCVVKKIVWHRPQGDEIYWEKLRLFDLEFISEELGKCGMKVLRVFGDEKGSDYLVESSPRMSIVAIKEKE